MKISETILNWSISFSDRKEHLFYVSKNNVNNTKKMFDWKYKNIGLTFNVESQNDPLHCKFSTLLKSTHLAVVG